MYAFGASRTGLYLFLNDNTDRTRAIIKEIDASTRIYFNYDVHQKEWRSFDCFRLQGIFSISSKSSQSELGTLLGYRLGMSLLYYLIIILKLNILSRLLFCYMIIYNNR